MSVTAIIETDHLDPTDWETIRRKIDESFSWNGTTTVYSYLERVSQCTLTRGPLRAIELPPDAIEGRVWDGERVEMRWIMREDGQIEAWTIQELGQRAVGSVLVERPEKPRRIYLLGIATVTPGEFTEGRYPGTIFRYPAQGAQPHLDRAWIEVVEYTRFEPTWSNHEGPEAIESALDEPLLVATRFAGVGPRRV